MTVVSMDSTFDQIAHGDPELIAGARKSLDDMLAVVVQEGGSDLHVTAGSPPTMRLHGSLYHLHGYDLLTPSDTALLMRSVVNEHQWETFERTHEYDLAYSVRGLSRFRVNLYQQRNSYGGAFRVIPKEIKPLDALGVPPQVAKFAALPRGLVLVTGPTGSGKTTTLASLLDLANRTRSAHIVTIEDPIEFLHEHKQCLVNQREVGEDTESFSMALKHALRQDPDIILVGELRDLETTSTALTAAETGHLVLATLHTQSAAQTIDRIIDIFPPHQQQEIRAQLSTSLQGVVTQALAPRADGKGRTIVTEIMFATPAIRNLIREGKNHQIPSFMQSGGSSGMLSFDQHLAQRVQQQVITYEQGLDLCHAVEEYTRLVWTDLTMPATKQFDYKVIDINGKQVKGRVDAPNETAAVQLLKSQGNVPLSVHQAGVGMGKEITIPGLTGRVKLKDLAVFSRQFATMTNSGLSLMRSLSILEEQIENTTFARAVREVRIDIEGGLSLSGAFAKHSKVFPALMIAMVRAGETGGFLDDALERIATNFEKDAALRGKVKSALTYPVLVLSFSVLMIAGVLIFIVPVFEKMFKSLGGKLPLPTQIIVNVSHALLWLGPLLIIAGIVITVDDQGDAALESRRSGCGGTR